MEKSIWQARGRSSKAIKPVLLSQYLGKPALAAPHDNYPAPDPVDPAQPVSALNFKDPLQFWDLLATEMNANPPPRNEIAALRSRPS